MYLGFWDIWKFLPKTHRNSNCMCFPHTWCLLNKGALLNPNLSSEPLTQAGGRKTSNPSDAKHLHERALPQLASHLQGTTMQWVFFNAFLIRGLASCTAWFNKWINEWVLRIPMRGCEQVRSRHCLLLRRPGAESWGVYSHLDAQWFATAEFLSGVLTRIGATFRVSILNTLNVFWKQPRSGAVGKPAIKPGHLQPTEQRTHASFGFSFKLLLPQNHTVIAAKCSCVGPKQVRRLAQSPSTPGLSPFS